MSLTTRYSGGDPAALAIVHTSAAPGEVDRVLDEVRASGTTVFVFDNAATASILANSVVVGQGCTATTSSVVVGSGSTGGSQSVSVGRTSVATTGATAVGDAANASATNAVALGLQAAASGVSSLALGQQATAVSLRAVSVGYLAAAPSSSATAIGDQSIGSGASATAVGASATASNTGAVAVGQSATASGGNGVAVGASSSCAGTSSVAIGLSASCNAAAVSSLAIGSGAACTAANEVQVLSNYIRGSNTPGVKHLSPAVAGGVNLGTAITYYANAYVDRLFTRAQLVDFGALYATWVSNTFLNATGAYRAFPAGVGGLDPSGVTYNLTTVPPRGFAAGSVFSDGSTFTAGAGNVKVIAIQWTDPGYSQRALVQFSVPYSFRAAVNVSLTMTVGLGNTLATVAEQLASGEYTTPDAATVDPLGVNYSHIIDLTTGSNKFICIMWKATGAGARCGGTPLLASLSAMII